jgi:hypothetical protein
MLDHAKITARCAANGALGCGAIPLVIDRVPIFGCRQDGKGPLHTSTKAATRRYRTVVNRWVAIGLFSWRVILIIIGIRLGIRFRMGAIVVRVELRMSGPPKRV